MSRFARNISTIEGLGADGTETSDKRLADDRRALFPGARSLHRRRSRPSSRPRNVPNRRFNNFQHIGRAGRLDGALNTERPRPRSPIVKF